MPQAKLTVTLPEGTWIRSLSRDNPDAAFRVLAAMPHGETGVGLLEVEAEDLEGIVAEMVDYETVTTVEPVQASEGEAVVQFETTEPFLLLAGRESGIALEPPVDISDGRATFEVTATRQRLSTLDEQLRAFGMESTLEYVYTTAESSDLLTQRQRELLTAAVEAGYYETPRECTLTELADQLGMAKSTVSETLHRAEGRVIREFVDEPI
jgi:hypothetical protein